MVKGGVAHVKIYVKFSERQSSLNSITVSHFSQEHSDRDSKQKTKKEKETKFLNSSSNQDNSMFFSSSIASTVH